MQGGRDLQFKISDKVLVPVFMGLVLGWAAQVWAIQAEDYVAVRLLEPPSVHPPIDCEVFTPQEHPCGAGPGFAGGHRQ